MAATVQFTVKGRPQRVEPAARRTRREFRLRHLANVPLRAGLLAGVECFDWRGR